MWRWYLGGWQTGKGTRMGNVVVVLVVSWLFSVVEVLGLEES